jgi:hypothetical protein
MPLRPSGPQPRSWIFVWLGLLVPVWAACFWQSVETVRWTTSSAGVMCQGLERYASLARGLPPDRPGFPQTGFLTNATDPASAERFFCAQYEATPRPLVRWRMEWLGLDRRTLAGTTLIVDVDDPAALESFLRELRTEAARQEAVVRQRELAPGLLLVQVL